MSQTYENIMVAIDGSHEAELAFEKGVNVSLRNGSKLTIAHVIDTRALQSVSTFDAEVYEALQKEATELLQGYKERAQNDQVVIEVQIDGVTDLDAIRTKFEANGLKVDEITRTTAKVI